MNVLDDITRDLDWRETEIAAMRIVLTSPAISSIQKLVLLRASWALLYAHYEGFCKNALITYYDFISRSGIKTKDLPEPSKVFALENKIKALKKLPSKNFLEEVLSFESNNLSILPNFPEVDTKSNLWPHVLIDLMDIADLNSEKVRENEFKLKTLVLRRNEIAHGENNMISEFNYYKEFEDVVYDVIYDLAFQIEERLSRPPFSTLTIVAPARQVDAGLREQFLT